MSLPTPSTLPSPSLLQRFARIAPYFREGRLGILVAIIGSLIGAATEPLIPELMKPLLEIGRAHV